MKSTNTKSFTDIVINGLKKAVIDLEEFNVQVSLGKMEARDAYDQAKKKMHSFIQETEQAFNADGEVKKMITDFHAMLDQLRVQLALGKAETRDEFEAQHKKISAALAKLEAFIDSKLSQSETISALRTEIVKFRIKLEILKLRFELKKMDAHEEFEVKKREFSQKLDKIRKSVSEMEEHGSKTWSHIKDEMSEAYSDLRKSFVG